MLTFSEYTLQQEELLLSENRLTQAIRKVFAPPSETESDIVPDVWAPTEIEKWRQTVSNIYGYGTMVVWGIILYAKIPGLFLTPAGLIILGLLALGGFVQSRIIRGSPKIVNYLANKKKLLDWNPVQRDYVDKLGTAFQYYVQQNQKEHPELRREYENLRHAIKTYDLDYVMKSFKKLHALLENIGEDINLVAFEPEPGMGLHYDRNLKVFKKKDGTLITRDTLTHRLT